LKLTPKGCYAKIKGVLCLEKILSVITENKIIGILFGFLLFIAGTLTRGQFIDSNIIISFIIPLFFVSIGFGFIFTAIFSIDKGKPYGIFVKSVLAPWIIVLTIIGFNKAGIDSPLLKAGTLFIINLGLFNKEINRELNYQK